MYLEPLQPAGDLPSPSARATQQLQLFVSLAGDQEVGLISLGDTPKLAYLEIFEADQEAVVPAKGGALR